MCGRLVATWKRVFGLSWPVMAEHVVRTGMRTIDVIVTGFFSPAAVATIGLADLYARLPLRIGLGLGGGAIALSSQDAGTSETPRAPDGTPTGTRAPRRSATSSPPAHSC